MAFLPLALNFFYMGMKESRYFVLASLVVSSMFFIHTQPASQALLLMAISYLVLMLWNRKVPSGKDVRNILAAFLVFAVLVGFWVAPMFANMDFLSPSRTYPTMNLKGYFESFTKEPMRAADANVGIVFTILALAGLGASFGRKNFKELSSLTFSQFLVPFLFVLPVIGGFMTKTNDFEKYLFVLFINVRAT